MIDRYQLLKGTPTFPASVYDNLPPLLKGITSLFDDQRERDIVLMSSLTVLSGCFSNIKGKYDKDCVHPNIYCFIVAPSGSRKGPMKYSKLLGKAIQSKLVNDSAEAQQKYDAECIAWKKRSKKDKENVGRLPTKPKYPVLLIPGDITSAAIYEQLYDNNGSGIIFETEADTLSGAMQQDWGDFSPILRASFQHETLSIRRKGDHLYLIIEDPRPSIQLSGTPDQAPRLIGSTENGLCSRFAFYCYSRDLKWIDPTPCAECPDLACYFEEQSVVVASIYEQLSKDSYLFILPNEQFASLSSNFAKKLESVRQFEGADAASAVYRLGLIAFRIAMVLSVLRHADSLKEKTTITCTDEDFKTAMSITDVLFEHSMVMYSLLPKQTKGDLAGKMRQFFYLLPTEAKFARKEANEIGESIGISEKTVGNYLEKLVESGVLIKPEYGFYQKKEDK